MKKWIRLQINPLTFPLAAALLFIVCFGLFLRQFGFFWDDWVQLLSHHLFGYAAYMRYFGERPLSGWTHIVFGPWMGESSLRWQIFTLSLRWGCVVTAWWLFQSIWPRYRRNAVLAALLFALYPGFTQQPISVAYHQHWLQYLLFLLSLTLMVLARQHKPYRIFLTIAALLCQLLQLSITEFFVGVELLRPVILWMVIYPALDVSPAQAVPLVRRLLKTMLAWVPYLLAFLVYSIWRGFFMPMSSQSQNAPSLLISMFSKPLPALVQLFNFAVIDTLNVLIGSWGQVFELRLTHADQPIVVLSWAASLLTAIALGAYLLRLKSHPDESESMPTHPALEWICLGFLGVLLGPAPLWLANKNILWAIDEDIYHSDRFTLAAMLWASLLLVGIISWLIEHWKGRVLVVAAIVGLLVGFQMRVANDYRWLSVDQSHFYWQLSWRAPAVQSGTALLSEDILFPYQGIFSTASAVNMLYPQPQNPDLVAYWMYSLKPRFNTNNVDVHAVYFDTHQRLTHFVGQTPDTLLLLYGAPKSNCLWVLRPEDSDYPDLSPLVKTWLPVSNLSRIGRKPLDPAYPSPQTFGAEPEHGWCYFFETADLARQFGDWKTAAALGDAARAKGFQPDTSGSNVIYEWMPFIEAYAHQDRWQDAADLTQKSLKFDPALAPFACHRWQVLRQQVTRGSGRDSAYQTIQHQAACPLQ